MSSRPDLGARATHASLDRKTLAQLWLALRRLLASEIGGSVRLHLAAIVVLLLGISGLNVASSYVARDLMTAIERRSAPGFVSLALVWASVFAALTVTAVFVRFLEERLGLLWREWLTVTLVAGYLQGDAYLHIKERGDLANPDQRITDDVRAFTATTLSFVLMGTNAGFGIVASSGVLWSISPALFVAAVVYAALGSLTTLALGGPLVRLNYDQSDYEASFRSELVHAGENAESLALLKLEGRLLARLHKRLDILMANMRRIIAVHRSVGFFSTGYNYGIQLLPLLIVGPLFIHGRVDFGVVTQSAILFGQLMGAFSLMINQFASISSYGAVLVRLGAFSAALEQTAPRATAPTVPEDRERIVYEALTLYSHRGDECLVADLSVTVETGTRLLITGTDEARRELFRATALGSAPGRGRVVYPGGQRVLFLPERPYVPPATLRELLVQTGREQVLGEDAIARALDALELRAALVRVGGLDTEGDFSHVLSLGEQQLLAVARVLLTAPAFVVLHNPGSTLAPEQIELALTRLTEAGTTYLTLGGVDDQPSAYDAVLEIHAGGAWGYRRASQLPSSPTSSGVSPPAPAPSR